MHSKDCVTESWRLAHGIATSQGEAIHKQRVARRSTLLAGGPR